MRRTYRLPYFRAEMEIQRLDGRFRYRSVRTSRDGPRAELAADYAPVGAVAPSVPGTLEHWPTERYCLYAVGSRARLLQAEIHHPPWPLRSARASLGTNTMPPPGVRLPAREPLLQFAGRQDVVIWPPQPA